ncbi:hypothetical protein [Nannocystis pusilla]|uniref:hypothetical protein n=1 Tax=Nannocystis pusilla TaxID=889268 RepID=UPI003B7D0849
MSGGGTRGWSLGRRLLSRGGGLYARTVLGLGLRDPTAGFVCYGRAASPPSIAPPWPPAATASRSR